MNHHRRKVLHSLFEHLVSANIAFKDVEHLLTDLGAKLEPRSRDRVALNGQSAVLHCFHQNIPKGDVVSFRHFLEHCGFDPTNYPL